MAVVPQVRDALALVDAAPRAGGQFAGAAGTPAVLGGRGLAAQQETINAALQSVLPRRCIRNNAGWA